MSRMTLKGKNFVYFGRHLETIMETAEIPDSNTVSSFDSASPQKPVASLHMQDSDNGDKTTPMEASRGKRIALPYSQIHSRTKPKQPKRWNALKIFSEPLQTSNCKNEIWAGIERESNSEIKRTVPGKPRDLKQVKVLFPEFFSGGTNAYFVQQCSCRDEDQVKVELVDKKVKEDPLIRSWLNLFGARYS